MGRRGPPPKPSALNELHGNPGHRRRNPREPKPRWDTPRCPAWLSPEAKTVWRRVVPELRHMRVLSFVDGDAVAAYCQTFARWKAAEEFLVKHGDVYPIRDEKNRVKCMAQFPQVAISRNLLLVLKGYQQEFGLTPSARTRIEVSFLGFDPDDPLDEFTKRVAAIRAGQHNRSRKARKPA